MEKKRNRGWAFPVGLTLMLTALYSVLTYSFLETPALRPIFYFQIGVFVLSIPEYIAAAITGFACGVLIRRNATLWAMAPPTLELGVIMLLMQYLHWTMIVDYVIELLLAVSVAAATSFLVKRRAD